MENKSFTTSFIVDQTPHDVFNAITNVREWWSDSIDGSTKNLNDEFSYHYLDIHKCRIKLIEVALDQKIVWHVLENYFDFTKDKSEWTNTKIIFEIEKVSDKTKLTFTHEGLTPEYECFDICSNAWNSYINGSLKDLITTGKGQVSKKKEINDKALEAKAGE